LINLDPKNRGKLAQKTSQARSALPKLTHPHRQATPSVSNRFVRSLRPPHRTSLPTPPTNSLPRVLQRPHRAERNPFRRSHLGGHHYTIGINEPSTRLAAIDSSSSQRPTALQSRRRQANLSVHRLLVLDPRKRSPGRNSRLGDFRWDYWFPGSTALLGNSS
jgi:hypothetical protein